MIDNKLRQIILILITTIIILITILTIVITTHLTKKQYNQPEPKTIIITDTISKVVYDTVFIDHYKTVKLPVTDTLYIDSVRIDSIFVQVPISLYQLDTVFQTDTTRLDLHIINSGYEVALDTLSYKFTYSPTPPVIKKKRHRFGIFVGPSVGVGYDWTTGRTLPSVGVGIGIGWTMKRY